MHSLALSFVLIDIYRVVQPVNYCFALMVLSCSTTNRSTVEDSNTMKHHLGKDGLLVCFMWLLVCCTAAAPKDYRRTMWVSTTGEDSPQCIHDTPASDPVPQPRHLNESCGSLNYALSHIQNDTLVAITCGTHVLEPLDSSHNCTPLFNISNVLVIGKCENAAPLIQCINGANLAFDNAQKVLIAWLSFRDCGEQLQHSDSLSDSSTLYFRDSKSITIDHIDIYIIGLYGTGISFIKHDNTITWGNVVLDTVHVIVEKYVFHGNGIYFEVLSIKKLFNQLGENIVLENIIVYSPTVSPKHELTFTGINITVMGDGEGGAITLSNVTIKRTTRYSGISLDLLDRVHGFNVQLNDLYIFEGWNNHHSNETNTSTAHSSIRIRLRGNSARNHVQIGNVSVNAFIPVLGSGLSIEVMDQSKENFIMLQEVTLRRSKSSKVHKRGLQVIVTGWARRNEIQVTDLHSWWHRASWGAGAYIEFSGHARWNSINLRNISIRHNHALRGGGIAVVCRDFVTQNTFKGLDIYTENNYGKVGGGAYVILQGSSNNNIIHFAETALLNNTAHCGGGMYIRIQDTTVASKVEVLKSGFLNNTLLPSEKHDIMGGGVHVEFSTVSATFKTDNAVSFTRCGFVFNTVGKGVGGGISVVYKHSQYEGDYGDSLIMDTAILYHNMAASGSACSFQSLPIHGKRLFRGVRITNVHAALFTSVSQTMSFMKLIEVLVNDKFSDFLGSINQSVALIYIQKLFPQTVIPMFQVETNTNMIFVKSVQITAAKALNISCVVSSQGIYALDSEIVLQANTWLLIQLCVATHGGAIALYGESYIRVGINTTSEFLLNHAFERGGAIYVSSAPGVVPVSNCFLQHDHKWDENRGALILFGANTAKAEGQSIYVSDIRNCLSGSTLNQKNITTNIAIYPEKFLVSSSFVRQVNFSFMNYRFAYNLHSRHASPWYTSNLTSRKYRLNILQKEVVSGPRHVATVDLSKPLTIHFIPGKQKQLPYTHAYDDLGSTVSFVFTVLIDKVNDSVHVDLDPFSKYTADFTVILHGIPQQHGMANPSFSSNISNISAVVRPPQLVLQSVDNKDLLLVMYIELQCCPPGYIYRYGSGDMGTCHCGMNTVIGIAECNETHPEVIGAVLERDHWVGYLPSNDQHSCDGQKFFTGPCPPGYCQAKQITLPENNSWLELQVVVCAESNRKGLLCGDCIEGKGVAVNFNGIRPVCASCEEGLSNVGIIVWVISEWVPMLAFMFVLMLFNVDLVSGRFNSFLLFAQLLAFSTIRGDAELGPVHNAFVRIYRFLYGMWNLDFFGVLLPHYCLIPNAHFTLLQTLLLHYSIGLFPLTVAITLTVLERSAEKWICCQRVDQCLRRMRRWKAKYSDGMSYDRALPAFVILGFTRFLVSSSYILVNQTITGEDGERKVVVWWQGSVPYGSIQHIAYFIPAIVILLLFVLLPSFLLLTLPIGPQLFGRLIRAVPSLRKLQRVQTFCSNVYTDRWVYHFVNVFQGCYKEHFRSFSSLYLFYRIVHLLVAVFIPRGEDALRIQIILTVSLLLLIATCQPYKSRKLNTLDAAILGNMALILILSLHINDLNTFIRVRQFCASLQMILIYLVLLYPGILLGKKVYLKCRQLRCCQKQEEQREDNAEPLFEAPAERLGNLVLITELRAGMPTSEDDDTATETETEI